MNKLIILGFVSMSLLVMCNETNKVQASNVIGAKKLQRPNIIYIMADDLTTQAISAYGRIYKDIDFALILLDLVHIDMDQEMQGQSFKSILKGNTPKDWEQAMCYHYYEFPYWHNVQPYYGIRTQKHALAHFNIDV